MIGEATVLSATDQSKVSTFFTRVYGWMVGALGLSALTAWATINTPVVANLLLKNDNLFYGSWAVELLLVIILSSMLHRLSFAAASLLFLLYAALTGFTLSLIFVFYTESSIAIAFLLAGSVFGAMSLYGLFTRRNLGAWGSFLFMSLVGLVTASIVNLFLNSPMLDWINTYGGILIFSGLTAYDHQRLKAYALAMPDESAGKMGIYGALELYLDFINLFLRFLQATGKRR